MGFTQHKKSNMMCPHCGQCVLKYEEAPAVIDAYCEVCGFRKTVTNVELVADYAKDDPVKALRVIVNGHQWDVICQALGGMSIDIPASGTFEKQKKKHKYSRRKHAKASSEQMDEIVRLKLSGKTIGQIAIKLNLHANVVTYIIYDKRRADCQSTIKKDLPRPPRTKKK